MDGLKFAGFGSRWWEVMTLFARFLGLALVVAVVLCVVVVLTSGHPQTALNDIGDLYHRVTH